MMWTELHWIEGSRPGKLAMAARPRGGEWLNDELASWRGAGVDTIFSLLTPDEEKDLELMPEEAFALSRGMRFLRLPIPDREVPRSDEQLSESLGKLQAELEGGRNVVLHCRQGIGRTGLAACLFVANGGHPDEVVQRLSAARGMAVPETPEQRQWIDHYARALSVTPSSPEG
ncbi:MAG: hypothetical protein K2X03_17690 [Bryobacteraceae bacterium]|nr:hypothetical protein [Bryobacteraceae bacterium]